MHDTEDKSWWVKEGYRKELAFVDRFKPLGFKINPQKKADPYAPDLIYLGRIADLKSQETPFFKAWSLFGTDPQYTVTFNKKDYERYRDYYPEIIVVFYLHWQITSKVINEVEYLVNPMEEIRIATLPKIQSEMFKEHNYKRRVEDTEGNAKSSYILDASKLLRIWREHDI